MKLYTMDCGCQFEVIEDRGVNKTPRIKINVATIYDELRLECPRTISLLASGLTKGVFQLESQLGRNWVKKLKPENLEHMAALVALLRPGCISGDTLISVKMYDGDWKKFTIKELYEKWRRGHLNSEHGIVSLDESSCLLFNNRIKNIIYSGQKRVYKVNIKNRKEERVNDKFYTLECTYDHKLLTFDRGWIPLSKLRLGDRIAVISKSKYVKNFRDLYKYENYTQWAEYDGCIDIGVKDTYDITVNGPNHNFIAGNVVVHNCLEAKDENGVSMTEHYCRRKNFQEETTVFHKAIEPILAPTYQVLTYQEQAMIIAARVAGFNLMQADNLRKAMGKKLPEEMAKVKVMFVEGAAKLGALTTEEAAEIFSWIEKAQRYSFNKPHAICYGKIGLVTAYLKSHFPIEFFTSWLTYAMYKQNPHDEVKELVEDAKLFDVTVLPPEITRMDIDFATDQESKIWFGLGNIKGVGQSQISKLKDVVSAAENKLGRKFSEMKWFEIMSHILDNLNSAASEIFILSGALSGVVFLQRRRMLEEWKAWSLLTDKEREWIKAREFNDLSEALSAVGRTKKEGGGAANFKRVEIIQGTKKILDNPATPLVDDSRWLVWHETNLLGIPLTASVLDGKDTEYATNATCKDVLNGKKGPITLAAEVRSCREIKIKNGKNIGRKMAFVSLADPTCVIDSVVMWCNEYETQGGLLVEGNTLIVHGEADKKGTFAIRKAVQI